MPYAELAHLCLLSIGHGKMNHVLTYIHSCYVCAKSYLHKQGWGGLGLGHEYVCRLILLNEGLFMFILCFMLNRWNNEYLLC